MTVRHSQQTQTEGIHYPFNWVVADATARAALSPDTDDLYKFLLQLDTSVVYMLTAITPTWTEVGGSGGGGFPFDNFISVDPTNVSADYDNIPDAMTAAGSGDIIVLGPGTYTLTAALTIKAGVGLVGQGVGMTTINCATSLGGSNLITIKGGSFLKDVTVTWTTNTNTAVGVLLDSDNGWMQNVECDFDFSGSGTQTYRGISVLENNNRVINCSVELTVTGSALAVRGLDFNTGSGEKSYVIGGRFSATGASAGFAFDLYVSSSIGVAVINGPILVNGTFGPTPTSSYQGHYFDESARDTKFLRIKAYLPLDVGDETTDLTTGTAKKTLRCPFPFYVTDAKASVNTAPVGADIIVDVNKNGSTIFASRITIDAGDETSVGSASPVSVTNFIDDDDEITIDIDQVGSSTAGKGLKVVLIGYEVVN